ncbi:uncharacterized protein BDZ99DRAFT_283473 [Mytilinidion resinicola]|uniref:F-box domain-containing protein n=1 Tax=Mytilinidion resinicola TaxID=574789 RepID=A0A6A6YSK7_9PEZI|nr:uncharacterized protein BDZ99DRAFT_283473 [Mytilinidion resinicola]KAF2811936.1 hypothetical protein BDZ99DRAFT_283473 [Mytilinidion resinicola]
MAVLLDLPSELLLDILSLVRSTLSFSARLQKSTYWALSLTSKRLNVLANPFLYHEYVNLDVRIGFAPFANTIVNRADLAAHVKRLALRGVEEPVNNADLETIQRLADAEDLPHALATVSEVHHRQEAVAFFLIVALSSKVECLHVESRDLHRVPWFILNLVLQKALGEIPRQFGRLRNVDFNGGGRHGMIDIINASGFLRLPSLETFQLRNGGPNRTDPSEWKCPARTSSVTTIKLQECLLSCDLFIRLIRSTKAVKNLVYINTTQWTSRTPAPYLWEHRGSLESIHWSAEHLSKQTSLISNEKGSMRDFQKLHTLIWDQYLLGAPSEWSDRIEVRLVDHLPSSLVTLVLKSCDPAIIKHLDRLTNADPTWLPNLKTVTVRIAGLRRGIVSHDTAGDDLRKIAERFASKNVHMSFTLPLS